MDKERCYDWQHDQGGNRYSEQTLRKMFQNGEQIKRSRPDLALSSAGNPLHYNLAENALKN